jgi:hypothetical protein
MILSPCSECQKRDLPKDNCMRTCEKIQKLQRLHLAGRYASADVAIDYGEEGRFRILSSRTRSRILANR